MNQKPKVTLTDVPALVEKVPEKYKERVQEMTVEMIKHPAYGTP
jgi:hypothetical protein